MIPNWLYGLGWIIGLLTPMMAIGLLMMNTGNGLLNRDEFKDDARRIEGGTVYTDLVWELIGETQRSLDLFVDHLIEAEDVETKRLLANEIKSKQRVLETLNRMLRFKKGAGED